MIVMVAGTVMTILVSLNRSTGRIFKDIHTHKSWICSWEEDLMDPTTVSWESVFNMFTMMKLPTESHIIHQEWSVKQHQATMLPTPNQELTTLHTDKSATPPTPRQELAITTTNQLVMSPTPSQESAITNQLDMWLMPSQESPTATSSTDQLDMWITPNQEPTTHPMGPVTMPNQFQDQRSITHHQDK